MRMRDLVRETGVASTTVHYYLRLGLLPAPEKAARNSALYSQEHAERLALIRDLRKDPGALPLASVRRILQLVDQGVEVPVAVALHRQVVQGLMEPADAVDKRFTSAGLARAAEIDSRQLDALVSAGVIIPAPGVHPPFDGADLQIARLFRDFVSHVPATIADLSEIAGLLKTASEKEMALRDRATGSMDPQAAAVLSGRMQEMVNLWHSYLFARLRQNEIAERGLGPGHQGSNRPPSST